MNRRLFLQGSLATGVAATVSLGEARASLPLPHGEREPGWLVDAAAFVDASALERFAADRQAVQRIASGAYLSVDTLAACQGAPFIAVLTPANAVLLHSLLRGHGVAVPACCSSHPCGSSHPRGSELARDSSFKASTTVLRVNFNPAINPPPSLDRL